ncbi:hypothetical protein OQA88_2546 [Cercophora sp. LCS_1]
MRFVAKSFLVAGLIVARAGDVFARFAADQPPLTGLFARQTATPTTSTLGPPINTISADPWHCATENVTQYFKNAPRPTGNVLSGIQSFAASAAAPCRATATGIDAFYCSITDYKGWCGFTTAAPPALLSSYSTYLSSVTSFWKASSSTMSVVSYTCPVAWSKPDLLHAEWLKCHLNSHWDGGAQYKYSGFYEWNYYALTDSRGTPLPTQPNLVTNCDAFYFVKPGDSCDAIASANRITLAQFLAWNPAAGATCSGLWANAYACVSIIGVDPPPPTTTTTSAGNGVTTPVPTQAGMVANCNKFHFVASGQTCAVIASLYSISTAQFTQWNPAANADCSGLWASTYACVGVIGTNPTPSPTTTTPTGVATPTPTQPGMVSGCKKFAFVNPGDTCAAIASRSGITVNQFVAWNTGVGGTACTGLWANTYACVGI